MSEKNHNREKHPSRGRLGTQKIKSNIDKAARRANQRVAGANTKPKTKPKPTKVPTIKAKPGPMKRRPTTKEQRDAGASVIVDYKQLDEMAVGGLIGGQKK